MRVKLDDRAWKNLLRKLEAADHTGVRVGVLMSGKGGDEHKDKDGKKTGANMVQIAAIHEYGAPKANIPERSFIRRTFIEKRRQYETMTTKLARGIIIKGWSVKFVLELLGQWGAAEVKKTIMTGPPIPPPLRPETIRRKKSDRPLFDTGQLQASITYVVTKGD
jgi:hypothetical protein